MQEAAHRLRAHVEALALAVGERNVFRPGSLDAAAGYIESQWRAMGCAVLRQACEGYGVPCANLEVRCGAGHRAGPVLERSPLVLAGRLDGADRRAAARAGCGAAQPLTQTIGARCATLRARPARALASTTASTSL